MSTAMVEIADTTTAMGDPPDHGTTTTTDTRKKSSLNSNMGKGIFLVSVTTMFSLAAVSRTFKSSSGPDSVDSKLYAEAVQLGKKAFMRATMYNAVGFGLLGVAVFAATGARSLGELGHKLRGSLPSKDGEFVHKFDDWPTKKMVRRRTKDEMDENDDGW